VGTSQPHGLVLRHLRGLDKREAKHEGFVVQVGPDRIRLFGRKTDLFTGTNWPVLFDVPWNELREVQIASKKVARANVGAIALFGVLGLAARREPETLVCLGLAHRDVFFACETSTFELRAAYARFVSRTPAAAGKIKVDGALVDDGAKPAEVGVQQTPADRLRQLAELRDAGLINEEEFTARRQVVLGEL
jgi:hypothetical protein